ncbi:LamG domain-containing protein [Streptomyces werraensis]|uniref:LamG domain-containing protein n=1 Tax=Streptomyces werraensis TaxID=68284 RepID=UPI00307BC1D7
MTQHDPQPRGLTGQPLGEARARLVTTAEKGRWYHRVGVHDDADNTITLYVDGKRAATATGGATCAGTGALAVGRAQWGGNDTDFWNGGVDAVQAHDKALTEQEVGEPHTDEKP